MRGQCIASMIRKTTLFRAAFLFCNVLAVVGYAQTPDSSATPAADTFHPRFLPPRNPFIRSLHPPQFHSFYLNPPPFLKYQLAPDTSDYDYLNSGQFADSLPIERTSRVPLDLYIADKKELEQNLLWGSYGRKYTLGDRPDQVTRLLKKYTSITLPVNIPVFATIFGKPEISIGVTGSADVHLSVRSDYTNLTSISALGSTQTAPAFSQDLTVNVNAKIGDKLSFNADWNTLRTFDFENLLKLKYTGHEDDIVQSVEAGNVTLQTPSQLIAGSQALFGLKVGTQWGPFYLTTLASQKKGETKSLTLNGSQTGGIVKHVYEYSQYHYFLDSLYSQFYEPYYKGTIRQQPPTAQKYSVVDYEVWVTQTDPTDQNARYAYAVDSIWPISKNNSYNLAQVEAANPNVAGKVEVGLWKKLDPKTQYTINRDIGMLHINEGAVQFGSNQSAVAVAVAFQVAGGDAIGGTDDDKVYGNGTMTSQKTGLKDTLVLRLIRPKNLVPSYTSAWNRQIKSIYSLNAPTVKLNGVDVNVVYYNAPGDSATLSGFRPGNSYLQWISVVGLDKSNGTANTPDGAFDKFPDVTIDTARGELIFPYLKPFDSTTFERLFPLQKPYADSVAFSLAYRALPGNVGPGSAGADLVHDKFLINMHVVGATSNIINLNAFNIAPGSVRVTLNGVLLTQGSDYTVDEFSGQVTIRNQQAMQPGANVNVQYEQNDVFSSATKTLLGARGDYIFSKNAKMGFTLFDYSQKIFTDKVRLGEEPISNFIGGLDGSAVVGLPAISKLMGLLPIFDSRAKTILTLRGEVAYVMPSTTGGNSNIATDGTLGTALLDDFEGARFSIPLAGSYGFWHHASTPSVNYNNGNTMWDVAVFETDSQKVTTKARLNWYNILPSDVLTTEIFPRRSVGRPSETTTVLNMTFDPHARGIYNYRPNLGDDPRKIWGGATRVIYNTPTDLVSQNVTDVEIWMKVITNNNAPLPQTGKMFLDVGLISEDVIPNNRFDTEDGINPDYPTINGILNPGEDVGIDGLNDEQENSVHAQDVKDGQAQYPDMVTDPAGDDWQYTSGSRDYTHINGVEGNAQSEFGRNPDAEDLNGNNTLDAANSYFEYEVNLDTSNANAQKIGAGTNGWTQVRIPLRQYQRMIGTPSFQNVQYVRVWFAGFTDAVTVRFAQMDLVGSRWQPLIRDTTKANPALAISFANYEDNSGPPDYYYSPPGVTRARNPYITDHIVYENEQSLAIKLDSVPCLADQQAVRYEPGIDLFSYNTLGLFVHGDEVNGTIKFTDTTNYTADFFVRIGLDTLNYYEYREPLHPGWDDIRIDFAALTAIKTLRPNSAIGNVFRTAAAGHPAGSSFAVRGSPTVTRVQYFALGVQNSGKVQPCQPLTTNVWVDELRLVGTVNNNDWAATASATLQLGELGQVQVSGTQTNPDYHSMDVRFGDRVQHQTWNFAAQTAAERVLKFYPGLSVPLVYSHAEELQTPRYQQQSDISVQGAAAQKFNDAIAQGQTAAQANTAFNNVLTVSQTLKVTNSYAIAGAKVPVPVKFWLIDETVNKLTYSFDYSIADERSPIMEHKETWQWNARIQYGVQIKPFLTLKPWSWSASVPVLGDYKDWKLNFFPTSFNAGLAFYRQHIDEKDRSVDLANPTIRTFTATRTAGFTWPLSENGLLNPTIDYNIGISSTLLPLELIDTVTERPFGDIVKMMFFHDRVFNLGLDNSLAQTVQVNMKPKLPHLYSIDKYTDIVSTYNVTYNWGNTLTQGDIGKNAGFNSRLTIGTTVKLKMLTDEWFGYSKGGVKSLTDTPSVFSDMFKNFIKTPLFDFDAVTINFTQMNTAQNQGLVGGTGVNNFWNPTQRLSQGPNRLYELGLISQPDGDVSLKPSSQFPFFTFDVGPGRRAAFGSFSDNFKQDNSLDLRTQRTLWTGATLTLSWKSQWIFNRNQSIVTDSLGIPSIQSQLATLDITRSYLTLPPFLFFSAFNNTVTNVVGKYQQAKGIIESDPTIKNDTATQNARRGEALADAFESGFEALGWFPKAIQQLLPRMNWTFRWEGLEKWSFLEPFAQRVSIEHNYSSTYTRRYQSNPDGGYSTQGQSIALNFAPLIGITMMMKDKVVGGNMSATARYNTSTQWGSQGAAAGTITKDLSTEISLTATYTRTGLPFPIFGLNLKNDIEASFTFSSNSKSSRTFDVNNFTSAGTPLDGTTTITAEPSVRYTISQRVNARLFYRLRRTIPDASGSKVPETSTVEAGIDIHVSISGGQ